MAAGLSCADFALEDGQLMLSLQNGMGRELIIESVRYESRGAERHGCVQTDNGIVANGGSIAIEFDESCEAWSDTWYDVEVEYDYPEGSVVTPKLIRGEIYVVS